MKKIILGVTACLLGLTLIGCSGSNSNESQLATSTSENISENYNFVEGYYYSFLSYDHMVYKFHDGVIYNISTSSDDNPYKYSLNFSNLAENKINVDEVIDYLEEKGFTQKKYYQVLSSTTIAICYDEKLQSSYDYVFRYDEKTIVYDSRTAVYLIKAL